MDTVVYPSYFEKYNEALNTPGGDNLYTFITYLSQFEESDWQQFLTDLFAEKAYPKLMEKIGKEINLIAYYAIYINKLPAQVRIAVDRNINTVVDGAIGNKDYSDRVKIILNALTLSRLLEKGVSARNIINKILLAPGKEFQPYLKFEAAATLSHYYNDVAALDFFKYRWEELKFSINQYQFLVFPRFSYMAKVDPVEAFATLRHFSFQSYIKPDDVILPLEDFFIEIVKDPVSWDVINQIFQELDKDLRKIILEKALASPSLATLRQALMKPVQGHIVKPNLLGGQWNLANRRMFINGVTANLGNESDDNIKILNNIEKRTNPYFSFPEDEIDFIKPHFIKQTQILNYINRGRKYFKQSDFIKAMSNYDKAFHKINAIDDPDNLTIYFYSWMLHEIGNINFVQKYYEEAKQFYVISYHLKNTIDEIPKTFMFATQLKILASFLETENDLEEVQASIEVLISHLTKYRRDAGKSKHFFVDCLLGDANYYLAKTYYRENDKAKFNVFFDNSLKLALRNNDLTGQIELYTLHSLVRNSDKYIDEIEKIFSNMNKTQKQNPYLLTLLPSYDTPKFKNRTIWQRMKSIFGSHVKAIDVASLLPVKINLVSDAIPPKSRPVK